MNKIKVYHQDRGPRPGRWTVEYLADEWNPPTVNVFDTFEAAMSRAKELGPLASCGLVGKRSLPGGFGTREDTLSCLAKQILDPVPKLKPGSGRGDTVAIRDLSGRMRFASKRTARRLGMKTSRSKPKTS